MSRVLPILFNTDMVRAILDGRKTVTRRLAKKVPIETHRIERIEAEDGKLKFECHLGGYMSDVPGFVDGVTVIEAPYQPGDILYVRESVFQGVGHYLDVSGDTVSVFTNDFEYYADGLHEKDHWKDKYEHTWMHRRPSIHMPKEAARIWLKVTDVRVERLQEITDDDCEKEGLENYCKKCHALFSNCDTCLNDGGIKEDFKELWNSTIKKSDLGIYGWGANPWVWVIEFERCEKPEG